MKIIPFDKREGFIWYNGQFLPWKDARLHVLNHGLHYSSCVFEGIRVYNGNIFKLAEHNQRLIESANILGFDLKYSLEEINKATIKLVEKQNILNGYIRPLAWLDGAEMNIGGISCNSNVAIATWQWPNVFLSNSKKEGITLDISQWRRPDPVTAPVNAKASGLYMICTMSRKIAIKNGFDDALMLDFRGYVAESTGANIFIVNDNEILTPIPDCFLNGITRKTIIELCKKRNIDVKEKHITLDELMKAKSIFLTGTACEIQPIRLVKDKEFIISDLVISLMNDYEKLVGKV